MGRDHASEPNVAAQRKIDAILSAQLQSASLFGVQEDGRGARQAARMLGSRPIRIVLRWQVGATAGLGLAAGAAAGAHGALSAALGGLVGIVAGLAFAVVVQLSKSQSAGGTLATALRAESVKIGLSVFLLWLVLTSYTQVVALAFIGSFSVSILIFSMAFFVRDYVKRGKTGNGDR